MRSAFALRIFSGKNIFNRAMPERLRTLRHCIFTGRGRKGKRQLPELPQSKPDGFASSLEEGASGAPANFALEPETVPLCQRPHLRGGWHRVAMTGGVFHKHFFCAKRPHSVQITKKCQIFCQISHTYSIKFEQIAKFVCF